MTTLCNKTAIFPGTFDPITYGHRDLITRATRLFDTVLVAVTAGAGKSPAFSLAERVSLVTQLFQDNQAVQIVSFSGLLVDFMQAHHISVVLRGLRTLSDVQYEFQLATMNQLMKADIETVFLKTNEKFAHISSTIVREIAAKNSDQSLGDLTLFVPDLVVQAFRQQRRTNGT